MACAIAICGFEELKVAGQLDVFIRGVNVELLYRGADKSLARPGRNKLERQKILIFIYPIYNHCWRNISTIYILVYNETSIKRNILTIKQNTSGRRSG